MNAEPGLALFRSEATEARKQRVYGEIVLIPSFRAHVLVLLICALMIFVVVWATLGSYARTETARGMLVTDRASAKVVAVRPGLVAELLVREGDLVSAGQQLAVIRLEQVNDSGGSAIGEGLGAIAAQRNLTNEQVRLAGRRASSDRQRVQSTIGGLRQQRVDLDTQIQLQNEAVASADDLFQKLQSVSKSGFVSRIELERRRQAWIVARQDLARLTQQRNALQAQESSAVAELARVDVDAGSEIATAQMSAESLTQRKAELETERGYVIAAPVAGRVTSLQIAVGRTVQPDIPIMEIIPQGSAVHAEVYAPTRAIGFVKPGQEVRLLYDAFPYQRFGSFSGRVSSISRTVIDPRQLAAPLKTEEPVYRIEVTPDAQQVDGFGERLPLQPGMALSATLVLERRSFMDWLLQPFRAVTRRNG